MLDVSRYNVFVSHLELTGIGIVKVHGERTAPGEATHTRFDLTASYLAEESTVRYRYDMTAHFAAADTAALGSAGAAVLITIRVPEPADPVHVKQFGATSAARMAHPFLRETIASTAQRIGFPDVLLPLFKPQPSSVGENE
jgi:hypothetical protein